MKTSMNAVLLMLTFLAYFSSLSTARAYYDPGTQRWLNRDPVDELGFNLSNPPRYARKSNFGHDFAFINNDPIMQIDLLGLFRWGKTCTPGDIASLKSRFADACKAAKEKHCFKCLSPERQVDMLDACGNNKNRDGSGPTVDCEGGSHDKCNVSDALKGTHCGWADSAGTGASPGHIHVCMNNQNSAVGCSPGCTLLHETAHAVGGVGADASDPNAWNVSNCACGK